MTQKPPYEKYIIPSKICIYIQYSLIFNDERPRLQTASETMDELINVDSTSFVFQLNVDDWYIPDIHRKSLEYRRGGNDFHLYADEFVLDNIILNVRYRGNMSILKDIIQNKIKQKYKKKPNLLKKELNHLLYQIGKTQTISATLSFTTYDLIKQKISSLCSHIINENQIVLYYKNSAIPIYACDCFIEEKIRKIEWTVII